MKWWISLNMITIDIEGDNLPEYLIFGLSAKNDIIGILNLISLGKVLKEIKYNSWNLKRNCSTIWD